MVSISDVGGGRLKTPFRAETWMGMLRLVHLRAEMAVASAKRVANLSMVIVLSDNGR